MLVGTASAVVAHLIFVHTLESNSFVFFVSPFLTHFVSLIVDRAQ